MRESLYPEDFSENRSVLPPSALDTPAHPPVVSAIVDFVSSLFVICITRVTNNNKQLTKIDQFKYSKDDKKINDRSEALEKR
jgi:hypothetical protein